jgi:hypothetical protein
MDTFKDFSWRSFSYRISLVQVRSSPYLNKDHIIHRWVVAHDRRGCSCLKEKSQGDIRRIFMERWSLCMDISLGDMEFVCGYFTWMHIYFA